MYSLMLGQTYNYLLVLSLGQCVWIAQVCLLVTQYTDATELPMRKVKQNTCTDSNRLNTVIYNLNNRQTTKSFSKNQHNSVCWVISLFLPRFTVVSEFV